MKQVVTCSEITKTPKWLEHFYFMGKTEREITKAWFLEAVPETSEQKKFLEIVKEAIENIDYDYWISTIEPSEEERGKPTFKIGGNVVRRFYLREWNNKAKEFAPQWNSDMANLFELFFWYAYRCAMGYWTLSYVCDDSSNAGNYSNSPKSTGWFEASGIREVGGFRDGIGNTFKLVVLEERFALCGGFFNDLGSLYPVATVIPTNIIDNVCGNGTPVFVLRYGQIN